MRYKGSRKSLPEIAEELKVDAVIEGTVQRSGGRVRVTAKLIPAATDSPVWVRDYERDLSDVLKLQSDALLPTRMLLATEIVLPKPSAKPSTISEALSPASRVEFVIVILEGSHEEPEEPGKKSITVQAPCDVGFVSVTLLRVRLPEFSILPGSLMLDESMTSVPLFPITGPKIQLQNSGFGVVDFVDLLLDVEADAAGTKLKLRSVKLPLTAS